MNRLVGRDGGETFASGPADGRSASAGVRDGRSGGHDHWNDHYALVYERREEQLAAVVPFLREGVERGEQCFYIYDDDPAPIEAGLRREGVDVDAALEDGRLVFRSVEETYLAGGEFDLDAATALLQEAAETARDEFEGFRVTAEETWLVDREDTHEEFMACEAHVNDLLEGEGARALCQYDRSRLPPSVLEDVLKTHPCLYYDGTVCENVYYTPPDEYFGPDRPARELDRKLETLVDRERARSTLRTREHYQRKVHEVMSRSDLSLEAKLDALFDLGCERFDLDLGGMARVDPATDRFEVEAISGDHDHLVPGATVDLSETYCRVVADESRSRNTVSEPVGIVDPADSGFDDEACVAQFGVHTYLGAHVPVEGGPDRTFFFVAEEPRDGPITDEERAFHRLLAQWVKYELDRRARERLLRDLYEGIADPEASFEEKIETVLELGRDRFDLEIGYFTRTDDERFEIVEAVGDHDAIQPGVTDSLSDTYCEKLLASPHPISVEDAAEVGWTDDPAYERFGLDAYFATTVRAGGEEYGTLCFASESPRERPFSDGERTFLDLMGQWIDYELERRRRERFLRESYAITSDPTRSFEEKLERLLEVGCEQFGLEMAGLNHLPSWDGPFRLETGVGFDLGPEDRPLWTDPGEDCFCRQAITEDEPVCRTDVRGTDWADDPIHEEFGLTSYVGTKVTSGSTPYGTLWFGSTEPRERAFTEAERAFVELIGQWVSYEVEQRSHERSQRELYEITADPDLDTEQKVHRLLDLGRDQFDLSVGMLNRWRGDAFEVERALGDHPAVREGATLPPASAHYCSTVAETGDPEHVRDAAAAGWDGDPLYEDAAFETYVGAPVTVDGDVYGTVCFVDTDPRTVPFTEAEEAFLDLLGQCVGYEIERQRHEADLEETIDRLEQSNDRLQQFAYAASHDLQEPLRMVSSYLQLLETRYAEELDGEAEEYIEFAVDGADRMRTMIEGLLAYSRVEQSEGTFEPVDCEAVLEAVTDDLQLQIEEADADLRIGDLPTVRGDRGQLEQLFDNLVSNAIKYNEGRPHVEITAQRRGDRWEIAVSDDGIGIDPEKTDRVFEVFKRLHHDDEYPGTGIGLSLCQEIAENHGGDVRVDSDPGEGSTFYVTLPDGAA